MLESIHESAWDGNLRQTGMVWDEPGGVGRVDWVTEVNLIDDKNPKKGSGNKVRYY